MPLAPSVLGVIIALAAPECFSAHTNLAYGDAPRQHADVYMPKKHGPHTPVVVFFYGGTWQAGDRGYYRFVGTTLASNGVVAVIPDYTLYPDAPYPQFLRDNAQAVRWAKQHAAEWGGDPDEVFLAGHSAGGYDAVMLGVDKRWLADVGLDPKRDIAGVIGLAGMYDFGPQDDINLPAVFGDIEWMAGQPIRYANADVPPMLLLAGENDTEVNPGNTTRMAAHLQSAGAEATAEIFPHLGHTDTLTSIMPPFRAKAPVLRRMLDFIHQVAGRRAE